MDGLIQQREVDWNRFTQLPRHDQRFRQHDFNFQLRPRARGRQHGCAGRDELTGICIAAGDGAGERGR